MFFVFVCVLRFCIFRCIFSLRDFSSYLLVHLDRVGDVVRIFFNKTFQLVGLKELVVILILGILLDMQGYYRAVSLFLARLDYIAVCAL